MQVAHTAMGAVGYRSVGTGPPLLLIMGFGGTIDSWTPDFVAALARSHTVISFDNAGIGQTATLPAPQTIPAMAEQSAALLTALHVRRAAVLGWSMGGMVAQALAVEHPELVSRVVLAATIPGNGKATSPSAAVVAQLTASATNPALILPLLFPASADAAQTSYVTGIYSWPDLESVPLAAYAAEGTAISSWTAGHDAVGHQTAASPAPTLITDGDQDVLIPAANLAALKATIAGSQTMFFSGAGHAFLFQDQTAFLSLVEPFLAASS